MNSKLNHNNGIARNSKRIFLAVLGFVILFILWSLLAYSGLIKPLFLPSPSAVLESTVDLFVHQNFLNDIFASVYRVFVGFLFGSILAIPIGLFIGTSKTFRSVVEPLISFLRYMPAAAFIPLAILWLGIGDVEKMFIIFIGTFPYLTLLVADVVIGVNKSLVSAARSFGASNRIVLKEVVIPASLPGIWDSLRIMAGIGWTYIIVAELVAARSGIGHVIIEAQRYLLTANIITGLITIGILGLITDLLFQYGYKKFFPYTTKTEKL
ncbi:MAG: ABC transporter permease [Pseudomonadota bacterium]